jgi:hypothetical protein
MLDHLLSTISDESKPINERLLAATAAVEALLPPDLRNNHTKSIAGECGDGRPLDMRKAAA